MFIFLCALCFSSNFFSFSLFRSSPFLLEAFLKCLVILCKLLFFFFLHWETETPAGIFVWGGRLINWGEFMYSYCLASEPERPFQSYKCQHLEVFSGSIELPSGEPSSLFQEVRHSSIRGFRERDRERKKKEEEGIIK